MNRREFLLHSAVAAATVASASPVSPATAIKVGFLGVSHSHGMDKLKLMLRSNEFAITGVAETDPRFQATAKAAGANILSRAEVLARSDVIIIESSVRDHGRDALEALAAGKHLHVEKPLAHTAEDTRKIIELASRNNLLLQVGYMWRYHPGFEKIFELVRNGGLGEIYQIRGAMHTQLAVNRRAEWAEFQGGAMFEQGCHLIDPMVRLLGAPRRILKSLRRAAAVADDFKDNNAALLDFSNGAIGIVSNSTLQPNAGPHRSFEVLGTRGTATLRPIEPATLSVDLTAPAGPYQSGVQSVPLPEYRRYAGDFIELAAAVRGGKLRVDPQTEQVVQLAVLEASGMFAQ